MIIKFFNVQNLQNSETPGILHTRLSMVTRPLTPANPSRCIGHVAFDRYEAVIIVDSLFQVSEPDSSSIMFAAVSANLLWLLKKK